uniref:hypothetical protein n=1 Tax=Salmonella sp. s60093 TaxID=3159721 RepID=UPI00398060C0
TASKWPTSPSERLRDVRTGWVTFDPKRRPNPAISVDVRAIRGKRKPNVTQTFDVGRRPIAGSVDCARLWMSVDNTDNAT